MIRFALLVLYASMVSAVHSHGLGSCSNPIFAHKSLSLLHGESLILAESPQPVRSDSVCTNVRQSDLTCCDVAADNQIRSVITRLYETRSNLSSTAPSKLLSLLFDHYELWSLLPDTHASPNITAARFSLESFSLEQRKILEAYVNVVTPLFESSVSCLDGVIGYIHGMLCLSCDVHSEEFNALDRSVLNTRWSTCSNLATHCQPVISRWAAALPQLFDLYIGFLLASPSIYNSSAGLAAVNEAVRVRSLIDAEGVSATSFCTSSFAATFMPQRRPANDCHDFTCGALMRGLDFDIDLLTLNYSSNSAITLPALQPRHMDPRTSSRHVMHTHSLDGGTSARRLLAVMVKDRDNMSDFETMNSIRSLKVSSEAHNMHIMHGGHSEAQASVKTSESVINTEVKLRLIPVDFDSSRRYANGYVTNLWGDTDDFVDLWTIGCNSASGYLPGFSCPSANDAGAADNRELMLTVIGAVTCLFVVTVVIVRFLYVRRKPSMDESAHLLV